MKKVLIVEDEAIPAFFLKTTLSKWGLEVVGLASDGPHALELAKQYHPDIILMDINLNGDMDGIEAASRMPEKETMRLVFITGYNNHGYRERAAALHPSGYFQKPVDMEQLQSLILQM